ncbi:hypothetical protein D3C76_1435110 [compost metagenome]
MRLQAAGLKTIGCVLGENVVVSQEAHPGLDHSGQAGVHLATVQGFQVRPGWPCLVEQAAQGVDGGGVGRATGTQFGGVGTGTLEIVFDQWWLVLRFVERHADASDTGSIDVALETGRENLVADLAGERSGEKMLEPDGEHFFVGQFL